MALTHHNCPECDTRISGYEHIQVWGDSIEQIKICEQCDVQWVVEYGDPIIVEVHNES